MALPVVVITDPLPGRRVSEPLTFTVDAALEGDLWTARTDTGEEVLCQRLTAPATPGRTTFVAVVSFEQRVELTLAGPAQSAGDGIRTREPKEPDAFVRLDTGYFDLEMCTGTAQGTGASKWGLRHFGAVAEGVDLLPSGNNAIGGFYGPFFTPENGLINPPEHTTVDIEVVERGPVLHHYRMHGTVPDGLLEELRGKTFSIDWRFTHGTPYFTRSYRVDDFQAVINGRSVSNKITVGDEFESGAGDIVFTRFEAYDGTRYRAGDPYAEELKTMVGKLLASGISATEKFEAFKSLLTGDFDSAHWDLYWRLFSTWEGALPDADIRKCLGQVRAASHVRADLNDRPWTFARDGVDVSALADETIFAGPAAKTVEYHPRYRRAMVWWTSQASGAFQVVQRRQSGWVNWGTNGENECPELPVGVEIKTAYGSFVETWTTVADQLEIPPHVAVG
ncbi:hypothetical protein GTZ78_19910 [Streptomyces sp. SID8361]|uniref:hypothetical protein n=1 Tax=Streptomyces sp. MnatMP-M27 TaxID=1839768 RepID=UPI00081DB596|nr:hypothetical protein [Streptomyces sp. MnatMP-M27]MYU12902.1 hypothetical protein [Streptomyces sp. SID8361]SCF96086.1 hypothetical protein GA0115260_105016 [Streptomyces sp. MnatMP-M27]